MKVVSTWARDPANGEPCIIVTETDITGRKQLEKQMADAQAYNTQTPKSPTHTFINTHTHTHTHTHTQAAKLSEEQTRLHSKVVELRSRLGLTQGDGFILPGEKPPKWVLHGQVEINLKP